MSSSRSSTSSGTAGVGAVADDGGCKPEGGPAGPPNGFMAAYSTLRAWSLSDKEVPPEYSVIRGALEAVLTSFLGAPSGLGVFGLVWSFPVEAGEEAAVVGGPDCAMNCAVSICIQCAICAGVMLATVSGKYMPSPDCWPVPGRLHHRLFCQLSKADLRADADHQR